MFMTAGLTSDQKRIPKYKFLITTDMKKFFLIASAFALTLCASAQSVFTLEVPVKVPKHLTPSSPSGIQITDNYGSIVNNMMEMNDRKVRWAFLDIPSFSPEYAVKCIVISGQPYLVAATASKNIWYNQPANVEILGDTLQVTNEQAGQLDALFRLAVETSTFMPYPPTIYIDENGDKTLKGGLEAVLVDGNSYTFFSERRAATCRNQLSPGVLKDLIEIGSSLYQAVKAKDIDAVNKVLERVEPTKQVLFEAAPEWYPDYLEAKTNDLW